MDMNRIEKKEKRTYGCNELVNLSMAGPFIAFISIFFSPILLYFFLYINFSPVNLNVFYFLSFLLIYFVCYDFLLFCPLIPPSPYQLLLITQ